MNSHEEAPLKMAPVGSASNRACQQAAPDPVTLPGSPTEGMNIAQRILHVGGRNNAAGYVEFGSIQAVDALVHHVLRDLEPAEPLPDLLPRFQFGDTVRKVKGAQWQGRVVGTYSTSLTPEGYCVESDAHPGSVQIYPAAALELVLVLEAAATPATHAKPDRAAEFFESRPAPPWVAVEQALTELIEKIAPGLGSGDILADAQKASGSHRQGDRGRAMTGAILRYVLPDDVPPPTGMTRAEFSAWSLRVCGEAPGPVVRLHLTDFAQHDADEFHRIFRGRGCSCCVSPPCNWCVHPGNPLNLDEDDEAWVMGVEE
jgi:R67 dihydrofolate reductase